MSEIKRKKLSGYAYKQKRLSKEIEKRKLSGAIEKFIKPSTTTTLDSDEDIQNEKKLNLSDALENFDSPSTSTSSEYKNEAETKVQEISQTMEIPVNTDVGSGLNPNNREFDDPATWRNLSSFEHQIIVENGPIQVKQFNFPVDEHGRRFSETLYYRKISNGELFKRNWLLYSKSSDAAFCFCCLLFQNSGIDFSSWSKGYKDWRNISRSLKAHETSENHMQCFQKWKEMDKRLKVEQTIDREQQRILNLQRQYWRDVMKRIIAVIQLCATQMLPLRGASDKVFQPDNGNFLKIIECLAKFDTITSEHLKKASLPNKSVHYLSKDIQNNIISLLGQRVRNVILEKIRAAKYYSIILDCTPDISKIEQMSLIIRIVTKDGGLYNCQEYFIDFLNVQSSTGENLTKVLLTELENLNLEVGNIRGQGYDNGSNMKGIHAGVQKRILDMNPKAFFVPCSCHSLNLVVNDAAKTTGSIANYFSIVQELYVFFSASTQRWAVLNKHVTSLTLKSLSDTRWESRIESVKPLRYQLGEIYDALLELSLDQHRDTDTRNKSKSLATIISDFKFICSTVVWYDILYKINIVSKLLQSPNAVLDETTKMLKNILDFLQDFRQIGFKQILITAKEIAEDIEIPPEFSSERPLRVRRKRKLFDYENEDETVSDPKKLFEVEFFNSLLDTCINSIGKRFEQLEQHNKYFNFLYDFPALKNKGSEEILERCQNLHSQLTNDIDPFELHNEIMTLSFSNLSEIEDKKPLRILNYIERCGLSETFPNIVVALRILLTIPVSVASGERSFSKLKIIKNYLRSTMSQQRLTDLAMLTIEKDIANSLDYDDIIDNFAKEKSRKVDMF